MIARSMTEPDSGNGGGQVAILLCTQDGSKFLAAQLESLEKQTVVDWRVFASDDASGDETVEILRRYQSRWGPNKLMIRNGPDRGFVANFLSLACDPSIDANYFCFCDQDDVWDDDKLDRALAWHYAHAGSRPALYCGRTRLIDEEGRKIGLSPLFAKPVTFQNALVQSIAGGNTMLFNRAARELLREAGPDVDVITHDWWLYMLVTGCGGVAYYDAQPSIAYRQHGKNLVGSNASWRARYSRARRLMAGKFSDMNRRNIMALGRVEHRLSKEGRRIFAAFVSARQNWLIPRIWGVLRSGVYHHTPLGTVGLVVATLLKKL
jgi:glycosyltransferase involved in cell wall biosynthesis